MKTLAIVIFGLFLAIGLPAQSPLIDSLKNVLRKSPALADTTRATLLVGLATQWTRINPDSALYFAKLAHILSLKQNFKKGIAESSITQGWVKINLGRFDEGLEHYMAALKIFTETNDEKGIASVYNGLGVTYGMQENYIAALPYFLKALAIFERTKTTTGITSCYIKIGTLYQKLHEYDKSLENYKNAVYYAELSDDKINQANAYNNMAVIYGIRHQYQECIEATAKAKRIAEQTGAVSALAVAHLNSGMAYTELQQYDRAGSSLNKALQYFKQLRNQEQIARTYNGLATLQYEKKEYSRSRLYIDSSNSIVLALNNKAILLDNYDALANISKAEGKFEAAITFYNKMLALKDTLYDAEKNAAIEKLKGTYDAENKQKTIDALQRENLVRTTQRNVLVIAVASGTLLVLLLAICFIEAKRRNKLLTASKEELKNLNDLKDKFFSILSHDLRSPIGNILLVIDFLTSDMAISNQEKDDLLKRLKSATSSTLETMDNLLAWGKFQSRNSSNVPTAIDVKETMARICRFLQQSAFNKSIEIVNRIDEVFFVYGDKDQFEFIMRNLVSNSIKFSYPEQKIQIWARQLDGFSYIYVRDFGTGMSKELQYSLFNSETRVSISGTAGEIGSGLGLLLCRQFVEQNSGTLSVKSEEGRGTTFAVKFPATTATIKDLTS